MATTSRPLFRRPAVRIALVVVAAFLAVAVVLLEPWNLFIDHRVAEPPPAPPLPSRTAVPCSPAVI